MASLVFFGKLGVTLKLGQLGCGHTHGAGAPLVACLGPNLVRSVHTTSPKAVHKVLARFNAPKHRFALSMRRGSTFQGTPSSLPIKGGPLPLLNNNTQVKNTKEKEKSNTTPWA
jgi:hypothetical protein